MKQFTANFRRMGSGGRVWWPSSPQETVPGVTCESILLFFIHAENTNKIPFYEFPLQLNYLVIIRREVQLHRFGLQRILYLKCKFGKSPLNFKAGQCYCTLRVLYAVSCFLVRKSQEIVCACICSDEPLWEINCWAIIHLFIALHIQFLHNHHIKFIY